MTEQFEFDVFLCHNSQDKPEVIEIANHLKAIGIVPWLDKWQLRPGISWQSLLESQIGSVKSAAVFVGSSGLGPWQTQEIEAFLREFVKRKCPVIPVLLANAPQEPQLPIFLNSMTWVDFRQSDLNPIEQLAWGITGNKPSEYLQNQLKDLRAQKKLLEQEIKEIEQRLNALPSVGDNKTKKDLQILLDWLSERDRIAARYGALALNKFPDLQEEVMQKNKFDQFCLEISCYLELIDIAIKRDSKFFLYEPELMPSLVNPIYKFACFDVYKETFRLIKISIPNEIEMSLRNRLIEYIDSFLENLQVYI